MSSNQNEIPGEVVERMEETFTTPYPADESDSEWNALISAIASEFEELEQVQDNVEKAKFVDNATGEQLNKLATLFQLERETNETDEVFRTRIKANLRAQLSSGTNDDIRSAASALLNADSSIVDIIEPYGDERPNINVVIPVDDFSEIETPGDVWNDVLDSVAAAGIDLDTIVDVGTFKIRVTYQSATSQEIAAGFFAGTDAFDGQGAFGAGDENDTEHTTALSYDIVVNVQEAGSATIDNSWGSSAFGAGDFDGTGDDTNVYHLTAGDDYVVRATFSEPAHTDLGVVGDFLAQDAFDGTGAFGAGDADSPSHTTTLTYALVQAFNAAANSTVFQGFGSGAFGAGAFDGSPDDGDTEGTTDVGSFAMFSTYTVPTSSSIIQGFGSDAFDGSGAFGAGGDASPSHTTAISTALIVSFTAASSTSVTEGFGASAFGAGSFDGAADDADVRSSTGLSFSLLTTYTAPSNTTLTEGFGADAFDGQGAFGAGATNSPGGTTGIATTLTVVWNNATSTTTDSTGFGSGVFDGSGTFD